MEQTAKQLELEATPRTRGRTPKTSSSLENATSRGNNMAPCTPTIVAYMKMWLLLPRGVRLRGPGHFVGGGEEIADGVAGGKQVLGRVTTNVRRPFKVVGQRGKIRQALEPHDIPHVLQRPERDQAGCGNQIGVALSDLGCRGK